MDNFKSMQMNFLSFPIKVEEDISQVSYPTAYITVPATFIQTLLLTLGFIIMGTFNVSAY